MSSGGGGTQRVMQTSTANIPDELKPLVTQSATSVGNLQRQYPLGALFQPSPQPIAPLTTPELSLLGQQVQQTQLPSMTAPELGALTDINQLAGGPIGSSPATMAQLQAFQALQAPQIAQDLAMAGISHGGAFPETMALARTAALAPALQQEVQNRVSVLPQLSSIGSNVAQREMNTLNQGLVASQVPQQQQQAIYDSNWQDLQRRLGLAQSLTLEPLQIFGPQTITSSQSGKTTNVPTGIWTSLGNK